MDDVQVADGSGEGDIEALEATVLRLGDACRFDD